MVRKVWRYQIMCGHGLAYRLEAQVPFLSQLPVVFVLQILE